MPKLLHNMEATNNTGTSFFGVSLESCLGVLMPKMKKSWRFLILKHGECYFGVLPVLGYMLSVGAMLGYLLSVGAMLGAMLSDGAKVPASSET